MTTTITIVCDNTFSQDIKDTQHFKSTDEMEQWLTKAFESECEKFGIKNHLSIEVKVNV